MTIVLTRKLKVDTQGEEYHVETEAEIRVLQMQAKEMQGLSLTSENNKKAQNIFFPRPFRGSRALPKP